MLIEDWIFFLRDSKCGEYLIYDGIDGIESAHRWRQRAGASEINSCNVQIKIKPHVDVPFNNDASN